MRPLVPRRARITTIVLALAAASGFAFAVVGLPWWSMPEVTIGPTYSGKCFGGECTQAGLEWVGGGNWIRYGAATWGAGLIATACLVGLAGAMAAKRSGALVAKMVIAAALAATVAAGAFVATFPGVPGMSIAVGVYVYFGAVLVTVAAAVVTLRGARAAVPA
jgi:hypothetical protein